MRALASWALLSAVALGGFAFVLFGKTSGRKVFLPGTTSDGHYQIEGACETCHGDPFAPASSLQSACERCHGRELDTARDSHSRAKFTDPRNAQRAQRLDARRCVTCHREHWPEATSSMGLTLPVDYCYQCHSDVGQIRKSHANLDFASCANTGCHRFHDNRATYEDYLVAHAAEPDVLGNPLVPPLRAASPPPQPLLTVPADAAASEPAGKSAAPPSTSSLSTAERDAPNGHALPDAELEAWAASAHARARVNCSGCHAPRGAWTDAVSFEACGACHEDEKAGWLSGRHGMRASLGQPALTPALARAPMQPGAPHQVLSCSSCHSAHGLDRQMAAVLACQGCHADAHSRAYAASPHARTWAAEQNGSGPAGSGVSCATCHLPRVHTEDGRAFAQHNQNDNLRPPDKMIRSVCKDCHGLRFSIDALADPALIRDNFSAPPKAHVPSIDWALARAPSARSTGP
jgi:hypothetical protein